MANLMPPAEVSTEKKKKTGRRRKSAGRRIVGAIKKRLGKVKTDLAALGTFWGQVAGSAAVASTTSGMLGNKIKLMAKEDGTGGLDARLALGAIGTGLKLSGKAGQWDSVVTNVTTGVLTSWLTEQSYAYGVELAKKPVEAPAAPSGTAPGAAPKDVKGEGIVIGNIYGVEGSEVGLFGSKEKRLEKKEARLKKKLAKIDAKQGDDDDDDDDKKATRRVVVVPGGAAAGRPWFRRPLPAGARVGPRGRVIGPRGRVLVPAGGRRRR
ncbi:MAG: hypothetical protein EBZ59_10145 [Planctomycetia bacterium]|nr:hypothetical protein [Planctomycetia bacterium]